MDVLGLVPRTCRHRKAAAADQAQSGIKWKDGWVGLFGLVRRRKAIFNSITTNKPASQPVSFPFLSLSCPHAHVIDIDIYSIQDTALGFGLVAIAIILTVTVTFNPRQMVDGRVSSGGPLAVRLVQP